MNSELLSCKETLAAHAAQASYTTTPTVEIPPAPPVDSAGANQGFLNWRFAFLQSFDGDLWVQVVNPRDTPPALTPGTVGTGQFVVHSGGERVLQLAFGAVLYIASASGTVHGAVVWGR